MIVYRASKPLASTDVLVNDLSFPSYPVGLSGKPAYIAYFAMPLNSPPGGTKVRIFARDQGGNEAISGVPYLLLKKTFRRDKMSLSERFLQQKMPEFMTVHPDLRDKSPIDVFKYVNSELRKNNDSTIRDICALQRPGALAGRLFKDERRRSHGPVWRPPDLDVRR
jgi:hypothetical protein